MKKIFILIISLMAIKSATAQSVELKINPIFMPFNLWQINAEFLLNDDIGIEPGVIFAPEGEGAIFSVLGKYYFAPDKGNDKFHIGMFFNYLADDGTDDGPGLGFYVGYKWLSKRNITFEIGGGLGRNFGNSKNDDSQITGLGQLSVGYRFNSAKKKAAM
jgi:hypothetical protein